MHTLIDLELWDKAKWGGVAYAFDEKFAGPPILVLLFENKDSAKRIFSDWQKKMGPKDLDDKLRVSLITGTNSMNPTEYKVMIGVNPHNLNPEKLGKQFVLVSRIHIMEMKNPEMYKLFVQQLSEKGCFLLVPGVYNGSGQPEILRQLGILKKEFNIMKAKDVGPNSLERPAVKDSHCSTASVSVGKKHPQKKRS